MPSSVTPSSLSGAHECPETGPSDDSPEAGPSDDKRPEAGPSDDKLAPPPTPSGIDPAASLV